MAVFHIVSNGVKFPMDKTVEICEKYGLPHVPVVNDNYIFPDTIEELQQDEFISQRNLKDKTDKNFQVFKMQKIESDKKPFTQVKEGRLIRIGKTTNGNSVVILR